MLRFVFASFLLAISASEPAAQEKWATQNPLHSADLRDLEFPTPTIGIAVGVGGIILRTENRGEDWEPISSGVTFDLNTLHFPTSLIGYAAGIGETLLKTRDGGKTWLPLPTGVSRGFDALSFPSADTGYATNFGNGIFRTFDGGKSWSSVPAPAVRLQSIRDVFFLGAKTGFLADYNEGIHKTIDAGTTWRNVHPEISALRSIHFPTSDTGYAISSHGYVLKTTNGGDTWVRSMVSGTGGSPMSIHFLDAWQGVAVGWRGAIIRTRDGGATWIWDSSGTDMYLYAVRFAAQSSAFAVGDAGTILRLDLARALGLTTRERSGLEFQAVAAGGYRYRLSLRSRMRIRSLDAQGRLVQLLLDEVQEAGDYKISSPGKVLGRMPIFLDVQAGNTRRTLTIAPR